MPASSSGYILGQGLWLTAEWHHQPLSHTGYLSGGDDFLRAEARGPKDGLDI